MHAVLAKRGIFTYYQLARSINFMLSPRFRNNLVVAWLLAAFVLAGGTAAQTPRQSAAELGSRTAKNGFKNEKEIQEKFNNWKVDADAKNWLEAMHYRPGEIESLAAT